MKTKHSVIFLSIILLLIISCYNVWALTIGEYHLSVKTKSKKPELNEKSRHPVFYCSFDSIKAVTHPSIGLGGKIECGSIVPGYLGNAYEASYSDDAGITFPREIIPAGGKGCIELWAKLTGFNETEPIAWSQSPSFIMCEDGVKRIGIGLSGNNGHGGGGVSGWFGNGDIATRNYTAESSYQNTLDGADGWHKFAVVWDKSGIKGSADRIALFMDGKKTGTYHICREDHNPTDFSLPNGEVKIIVNDNNFGTVTVDELKIYDYAKTDFNAD